MSGRLIFSFNDDVFDHSFAAAADDDNDEGDSKSDDDSECVSLLSSTLSMTCDPYIVPAVVRDPKVHIGRRESSCIIQDSFVTSSECYDNDNDDNDDNDNDDDDNNDYNKKDNYGDDDNIEDDRDDDVDDYDTDDDDKGGDDDDDDYTRAP